MNPATEGLNVQAPRELEKRGGINTFYTRKYPEVRGGQCEFCGVVDPNQPATMQYKLCPHYRGMNLECSYCDSSKDQDEVTRISRLKVYDHPFKKDSLGRPVLGIVCDSYQCRQKFDAEYRKSG